MHACIKQDSWKQNRHKILYQMLQLYKDKTEKFWVQNMRRAMHTFCSDSCVWNEFHELFKANADEADYAAASALIFPILAQSDKHSLSALYKAFKESILSLTASNEKYNGPSLRSISALLEVCCKNIEKSESVEIALDLYKISKDFKIDLSVTTSTDFFDYLFEIFAFNESPIGDFNALYDALSNNVSNQVLVDSTKNAIKKYLAKMAQIEIFDNCLSDLSGNLFFDNATKLQQIKLPKFRLSVIENSEIWEQLRLTQINDASHLAFESKLFLSNKSRMMVLT